MNTELLKKEIEHLESDLEETEQYVAELEKKLEESKNTKATAKENLGEVFSLALESMIRRNTHLLGGIPLLGQGLAGVVEQDNKRLEDAALSSPSAIEERNVTFKRAINEEEKQPASKGSISKEDEETLAYFQSIRQAFTETELLHVLQIIAVLSHQKESITSVLELLKEESESEAIDETVKDKANMF